MKWCVRVVTYHNKRLENTKNKLDRREEPCGQLSLEDFGLREI